MSPTSCSMDQTVEKKVSCLPSTDLTACMDCTLGPLSLRECWQEIEGIIESWKRQIMCALSQQIPSDSLLQNQHGDAVSKRTASLCDNRTIKISTLRGLCSSWEYRPMHQHADTTVSDWNNRPTGKGSGTWGSGASATEDTFSTAVSWSFALEMHLLKCRIKEHSREAANVSLKPAWCVDMAVRMWLHRRGCLTVWTWSYPRGRCSTLALGKRPREPVGAGSPLVAFKVCCVAAAAVPGRLAFEGREHRPLFSVRRIPSACCKN